MAARSVSAGDVTLDAAVVIWNNTTGWFHVLNPSGAILWSCVDGHSSLGDICDDVAEILQLERADVFGDAVALFSTLVDMHIVVDARRGTPDVDHHGHAHHDDHDVRNRAEMAGVVHDQGLVDVGEDHAAGSANDAGPADPDTAESDTSLGDLGRMAPLLAPADMVVGVGEHRVGVSVSDDELLRWLEAILAPALVDPAQDAAVVYLDVGTAPGRIMPVHFLYERARRVLRTADRGRLVRCALRHIDALSRPPGGLELSGTLLINSFGALVVHSAVTVYGELPVRTLARQGWTVVDVPAVVVDPTSAEVVLGGLEIPHDAGALAEFDQCYPRSAGEWDGRATRVRLRALVEVTTHTPPNQARASNAERLAWTLPMLVGRRPLDADAITALAGLLPQVEVFSFDGGKLGALESFLERASREARLRLAR